MTTIVFLLKTHYKGLTNTEIKFDKTIENQSETSIYNFSICSKTGGFPESVSWLVKQKLQEIQRWLNGGPSQFCCVYTKTQHKFLHHRHFPIWSPILVFIRQYLLIMMFYDSKYVSLFYIHLFFHKPYGFTLHCVKVRIYATFHQPHYDKFFHSLEKSIIWYPFHSTSLLHS